MSKTVELTLPAILFLDGQCHLGDTIKGRTLLLHVRTASIVEIFEAAVLAAIVITRLITNK